MARTITALKVREEKRREMHPGTITDHFISLAEASGNTFD